MAFSRPRWRRATTVLLSGLTLAAMGATLVLAWQMGRWATVIGALISTAWILGWMAWPALGDARTAPPTIVDEESETIPIRVLLDQVPTPVLRINKGTAHALNRAARALFNTDERISPAVPQLFDTAVDRLAMRGRLWRLHAVEMTPGHRLLIMTDVEAETRTEEIRANAEMIDILGHELLNGLSPIVSLADSALTASTREDPLLPDILSTLARRVEGLQGFTNAYRSLSRLPAPVLAPVSLRDVADDLERLFSSHFSDKVALSVNPPPDRMVRADRDQLTQALWALLQNGAEAAQAGARSPEVGLTFLLEADTLSLRIADSGDGVPTPDRARIFRPFFTTKPQGSGIGLSLAQRIARAQGGDLRLLPIGTTTFELRLTTLI